MPNMHAKSFLLGLFISFFIGRPAVSANCTNINSNFEPNAFNLIWSGDLSRNFVAWDDTKFQFGLNNLMIVHGNDPDHRHLIRVRYPKFSYDPGSAVKGLAPLGGAQFTSRLNVLNAVVDDAVVFSYDVKFSDEFDFVRGGKLPGIYGGIPKSGGNIPNGFDGFSTRFVWQQGGDGALYAYLPTSNTWGTVFGKGTWKFKPGEWVNVAQFIKLNQAGRDDGEIAIWVNRSLVYKNSSVRFRETTALRIDGIFFSTFFGGNDPSWASTAESSSDFSDFKIYSCK